MSLKSISDLLDLAMRTTDIDDQIVLMAAAAELAHLNGQLEVLQQKATAYSWSVNPDRSGGQFTQQEIQDAERNRW